METLSIEWRRGGLADREQVASAMRVSVGSPAEASRVFNALGAVLRALTVDEAPPVSEGAGAGRATLDPRNG